MFKRYVVVGILGLLLIGCTSKETIPSKPPKNKTIQTEEVRSVTQMESKLKRIRNPIEGEDISAQKKDAKHEIDTLLNNTRRYKNKLSRFEKIQVSRKKSYRCKRKKNNKKTKQKSKKKKTNKVNNYENKLKYY